MSVTTTTPVQEPTETGCIESSASASRDKQEGTGNIASQSPQHLSATQTTLGGCSSNNDPLPIPQMPQQQQSSTGLGLLSLPPLSSSSPPPPPQQQQRYGTTTPLPPPPPPPHYPTTTMIVNNLCSTISNTCSRRPSPASSLSSVSSLTTPPPFQSSSSPPSSPPPPEELPLSSLPDHPNEPLLDPDDDGRVMEPIQGSCVCMCVCVFVIMTSFLFCFLFCFPFLGCFEKENSLTLDLVSLLGGFLYTGAFFSYFGFCFPLAVFVLAFLHSLYSVQWLFEYVHSRMWMTTAAPTVFQEDVNEDDHIHNDFGEPW